MKKLYIFLILLVLSNIGKAQPYIKMIDTTNVWGVLCGGITTNGEDFRQTDKLQFIGDTVVNDTIYHKLYSRTHFTSNDSALQFIWALREDTLQKKIYTRLYAREELIFNFSMLQGDSVITFDSYGGVHHYVKYYKVDSIINIFFANKIRKKFYISDYYYRDTDLWGYYQYRWIEGIGKATDKDSILGPIEDLSPFPDRLLCFWQSGQLLYQDSTYLTCLIVHVGINVNTNSESSKFYPNPTINKLTIETLQKSTIEILNIQGQIIVQQQIPQGKTDIDISGLAKGVYILRLCRNDMTEVAKIVKK